MGTSMGFERVSRMVGDGRGVCYVLGKVLGVSHLPNVVH